MIEYKVDRIHSRFDRGTNQLILWLFNDDSYYAEKSTKRIARYDFGRIENDRKIKLEKGLYREPYKDGWKYVINTKLHPVLVKTVERYNNYGFTTDEDGKEVPFTYLRHNRKALGIHYMIERYTHRNDPPEYHEGYLPGIGPAMLHFAESDLADFPDQIKKPYFPTPKSYKGINPSQRDF